MKMSIDEYLYIDEHPARGCGGSGGVVVVGEVNRTNVGSGLDR